MARFHWMLATYAVFWLALAIRPRDRVVWAVENLFTAAAVATLLSSYATWPLSDLSYGLLFFFLAMHAPFVSTGWRSQRTSPGLSCSPLSGFCIRHRIRYQYYFDSMVCRRVRDCGIAQSGSEIFAEIWHGAWLGCSCSPAGRVFHSGGFWRDVYVPSRCRCPGWCVCDGGTRFDHIRGNCRNDYDMEDSSALAILLRRHYFHFRIHLLC